MERRGGARIGSGWIRFLRVVLVELMLFGLLESLCSEDILLMCTPINYIVLSKNIILGSHKVLLRLVFLFQEFLSLVRAALVH